MPEITVPSDGTVKELVDVVDAERRESYHVRVKDDNVRITQTDDERYADHGNIYPQGASTWLQVSPGNALYAVNAGSVDATVEVDQSPAPAAVTQDPAASGTATVTDDGNFNLAGNQDVDIAEQSLASLDVSAAEVDVDVNSQTLTRLASAIEATNGTSYAEIQRNSNDLRVSVEQDNATDTDSGANASHSSVSLGTSDTQLLSSTSDRRNFTVLNNGSAVIYIEMGGNAADTADGLPIEAGQSYTDEQFTGEVRGIADSGTQDIRIAEVTN